MTHAMVDPAHWMQPPADVEIDEAALRARSILVETPLLESEQLNRRLGGRLLVKAEGLQRTGSFKARGAWNRLSLTSEAERRRGVVTLSSGNHGQAVAWAAQRLGISPVVILMPQNSPEAKVHRTRAWGAEVEFFDRNTADRTALIRHWEQDRGHAYVSAYDDRRIIAGAGTLAREAMRQAEAMGAAPDGFVVACSGGGLAAGSALALADTHPAVDVWAVEPEGYDDTARSLASGVRVANTATHHSICDALLAPMPGELTFAINAPRLKGAMAVADRHARAAMAILYSDFGLVVEPSGALPLAAIIAEPGLLAGRTVIVVASGSNVDAHIYADVLGTASV